MKLTLRLSGPLALSLLLLGGTAYAQDATPDISKLSYAIGYDIGINLSRQGLDLDIEQVMQAVRDTHNEVEPSVPREEMRELLTALNERLKKERLEEFRVLADENQTKSNEYLATNRQKEGVVALPSGVQYRVIESGAGSRPGPTETVTVHYRGSRMDGLEFDSSFARGKPESFQVDKVLQGWQEVLPLMREGAVWQVFVPPEMAFGLRGQPPVGPNEAVKFDLELVQIGAVEESDSGS